MCGSFPSVSSHTLSTKSALGSVWAAPLPFRDWLQLFWSGMSSAAGAPCLSSSSRSSSSRCRAQHARAVVPRRLQVAACHRCVVRTLIARPPPSHTTSSRGLAFAAAVKGRNSDAQPDAAAEAVESSSSSAGGSPPTEAAATRPQQPAGLQRAPGQQQEGEEQEDSAGVKAALAMLRFYKSAISPLLQPACRFLPTCSGAPEVHDPAAALLLSLCCSAALPGSTLA